jgi:RNA polymerase sigma factor (sigma-70 family)
MPKARQTDIEKNMGLVYMVAKRMKHLTTTGSMEFQDLVSEGTVGLIKALERFDPTWGVRFSSFAVGYIRGFMLQGHRNLHMEFWKARDSRYDVPSTTISIFKKVIDADDELNYVIGLDDRGTASGTIFENAHNAMLWRRILPLLTRRQREIFLLMIQGVPQKEIAPMFGVSRQAVSQAYLHAVKKAKDHFAKEAA